MEGGKDQLREQIQSLKTLPEDSLAKEVGMRAEREQLQLEVWTARQETHELENENKTLQETNDCMALKIQELGEVEMSDAIRVIKPVDAG